MRCPKCGYYSFDYNESCPKCKKSVISVREMLGLPKFSPQPALYLEAAIKSLMPEEFPSDEQGPDIQELEAVPGDESSLEADGADISLEPASAAEDSEILMPSDELEEVHLGLAPEEEVKSPLTPAQDSGEIEFQFDLEPSPPPVAAPPKVAEPIPAEPETGPTEGGLELTLEDFSLETEQGPRSEPEVKTEDLESGDLELVLESLQTEAVSPTPAQIAPQPEEDLVLDIDDLDSAPTVELPAVTLSETAPAAPTLKGDDTLEIVSEELVIDTTEIEGEADLGDLELDMDLALTPADKPAAQPKRITPKALDPTATLVMEMDHDTGPGGHGMDIQGLDAGDLNLDDLDLAGSSPSATPETTELELDLGDLDIKKDGHVGINASHDLDLELDLNDLDLEPTPPPVGKPPRR